MTRSKKIKDQSSATSDLIEELKQENEFLLKLVDTIPAKIYFDPDIHEKIASNIHEFIDSKFAGRKLSVKGKHKRARLDPSCQKSVSQIHNELDNVKKRKSNKIKDKKISSSSITRAANIEELQKKLHEHINELKTKRKALGKNYPNKKKLAHKMKKIKKKISKIKTVKLEPKEEITKTKIPKKEIKEEKEVQTTANGDASYMYGKLDFSQDGIAAPHKKSEFSGKNYKNLLKKVEKKKEKLENLRMKDPEKAKEVEEKEKWKKAILKSENVKIKDDPVLLKKSLKKLEKRKKQSAQKWKERIENMEESKKRRQAKRSRNIKMKKDEKFKKKIKLAKKKNRVFLKD